MTSEEREVLEQAVAAFVDYFQPRVKQSVDVYTCQPPMFTEQPSLADFLCRLVLGAKLENASEDEIRDTVHLILVGWTLHKRIGS